MSRWQAVGGAIVAVDLELLDAVHALQSSEALQRNLRRAGDKLQEFGPVGLVERAQGPPEPLDLRWGKAQIQKTWGKRGKNRFFSLSETIEQLKTHLYLDGAGLVFVIFRVGLQVIDVDRWQA